MRTKIATFLISATAICLSAAPPALSIAPLTNAIIFQWVPSPDPLVTGYNLYQGLASYAYTQKYSTTQTDGMTITDVAPGGYFFAATAVDSLGEESGFSNEVTYTEVGVPDPTLPPAVLGVTVTADAGTTITLQSAPTITGPWTTTETQVVPAGGTLMFGFVNNGTMEFFRLL